MWSLIDIACVVVWGTCIATILVLYWKCPMGRVFTHHPVHSLLLIVSSSQRLAVKQSVDRSVSKFHLHYATIPLDHLKHLSAMSQRLPSQESASSYTSWTWAAIRVFLSALVIINRRLPCCIWPPDVAQSPRFLLVCPPRRSCLHFRLSQSSHTLACGKWYLHRIQGLSISYRSHRGTPAHITGSTHLAWSSRSWVLLVGKNLLSLSSSYEAAVMSVDPLRKRK